LEYSASQGSWLLPRVWRHSSRATILATLGRVLSINGTPASQAIEQCMKEVSRYSGHSSQRYLQYQAARWFVRQLEKGTIVTLEVQDTDGHTHTFKVPADLEVRYLPRLPIRVAGIADAANVSWTMLDDDIGLAPCGSENMDSVRAFFGVVTLEVSGFSGEEERRR
jgi:hypothetical protein